MLQHRLHQPNQMLPFRLVQAGNRIVLAFVICAMLGISLFDATASAAPYEGYNYGYDGKPIKAPLPYEPSRSWTGEALGVGALNSPEDMTIGPDGTMYVLDTGNNRLIALNDKLKPKWVVSKFTNQGATDTFERPQGLFVTEDNRIYVADTGKARIVELTPEGNFVRALGTPKSDMMRADLQYVPIKLVVDRTKRFYVVSKGVFDGIMELSPEGEFNGFIGVNPVLYNPIELFWKQFATKEQRKQMALFIPVEFNNISLDDEGFMYVTTADEMSTEPVRRLNPSGVDVLKRKGYEKPMGDLYFSNSATMGGFSTLIAVTADKFGMYSVLDNKRGRIFTYDKEGKLLYIFGQNGDKFGQFKAPIDLEMSGDKVLILDKGSNQIIVFEPTRYGRVLRKAVELTEVGNEEEAEAAWEEALKLNNNLDMAHVGLGKAKLRAGESEEAIHEFRQGMRPDYYSRAFKSYRKQLIWDQFGLFATLCIVLVVGLIIGNQMLKGRLASEPGKIRFAWKLMFRPFKSFWELKYEQAGHWGFSLLLLLIFIILSVIKRQFTGFIIFQSLETQFSIWMEVQVAVIPFFLWCIANWSLTTLMDGEGKFKEIVTATGYALMPLIVMQIPLLILSNIMTQEETSFYYMLESISYIWCALLLFVGMLTVHQYTASKTVVTMGMTFVVIGIILFLGLLAFSLGQQMIMFVSTVYQEISFRIGEG
ncbi:hypothetical protein AZ66_28685 [Paenibacillus sp. E194]|uniref:YIP1 family protein n=1 Tax=Paenibacillus sp. E194 TaxID=1458845 RepID=UPI0005E85B71|nr:YIP1 family protein [Paenibacillus sp. E194]KJB84801.1 hypothetical protein AZ66_28685 [Paenibacillus sp. E194]